MLELGGAIVGVCAGIPVLCGLLCLCYVRCFRGPSARSSAGQVRCGYGAVSDDDGHGDEGGNGEEALVAASELRHDPYDTPSGSVRPTPRYARTASEHANQVTGRGPGRDTEGHQR